MTHPTDPERLRAVFADPGLTRLLDHLQRRFERGVQGPQVTLPDATGEQRRAIAGLLGRPPGRGGSLRIRVADLEGVLRRAGLAPDLRTALEVLRGPLRDIPAERVAAEQAWHDVFRGAHDEASRLGAPAWLEGLRAGGVLKRLAGGNPAAASTLLDQALRVLGRLPGRGQALSTLAAAVLGDAHALDPSRPAGTLVKRALGHLYSARGEEQERERELWAAAGIVVGGAITSTVLVLNLPGRGDSVTAGIVQATAQAGQPVWLTLRQLVQDAVAWEASGRTVHVCENPAVVAETADRLGVRCPPLICTTGQPTAAVNHLLGKLGESGARLVYHGDFDWPGIAIANAVIGRFGALPWCYDARAYRAAAVRGGIPLAGRPVPASWDPGLTRAMRELGVAIPEERVLEDLWASLGAGDG